MDKNRKSEKDETSKTDKSPKDIKDKSSTIPNIGSLTTSLDTLKDIAEKSRERGEGKVVPLPKDEDERNELNAGSAKELIDELNHKYARPNEISAEPVREKTAQKKIPDSKDQSKSEFETPGVVELLGALKSDIDSLRVDNEEFKAQLISSTSSNGENSEKTSEDLGDVRSLLEALKADIGELRHENELLRTQTFEVQGNSSPTDKQEDELFGMLSELKDDIVSLRSENDDLRKGLMVGTSPASIKKTGQAASLMRELKSDINKLKHDNEALRLEELTARDGAHFKNLGGQKSQYKDSDNPKLKGFLKELGVLALIAGAAGGGYYIASMKATSTNPGAVPQKTVFAPSSGKTVPMPQPVPNKVERSRPPLATKLPHQTPPIAKPVTPKKSAKAPAVQATVEAAMMSKADGLLETRDLGAARMVFVYLARHGSAKAMTRLAQTYDPQYLKFNRFDVLKNGDLVRAKKLYGVASAMGDELATARLENMR